MTAAELPELRGRRVTLRRPGPGDASARLALGSHAEIVRMYGGSKSDVKELTIEAAQHWVASIERWDYAWIIDAPKLIGHIRLGPIVAADRRASLGIGIEDPAALGKGIGTEAIDLVLDYAFGTLALHRVGLRVVAYNARAIRAYEKCGFRVEGRERQAAFVDGEWHDDVMMGILADEHAARGR